MIFIPQFKKGGEIHIKPENKGKFTATKKETGKTTEELTHSKNPITKKRAIFAQNAAKWDHTKKKQIGGVVSSTNLEPLGVKKGGLVKKKQSGGNIEFITKLLSTWRK